jgi:hypothetical protein
VIRPPRLPCFPFFPEIEFSVSTGSNCTISNVFAVIVPVLEGTKRHNSPKNGTLDPQQPDNVPLSLSFVSGDSLGVRVQCDSTGSVAKKFLHHLNIRSRCAQQG